MPETIARTTLASAVDAAKHPVRVPWRAPLEGFVLGFLAALLPAAVVATTLPPGRIAGVTLLLVALVVGLACAVGNTARVLRP